MLHMLFLDVAKTFIGCMQHVTYVAAEILLLYYRLMLGQDVGRPGVSKFLQIIGRLIFFIPNLTTPLIQKFMQKFGNVCTNFLNKTSGQI